MILCEEEGYEKIIHINPTEASTTTTLDKIAVQEIERSVQEIDQEAFWVAEKP